MNPVSSTLTAATTDTSLCIFYSAAVFCQSGAWFWQFIRLSQGVAGSNEVRLSRPVIPCSRLPVLMCLGSRQNSIQVPFTFYSWRLRPST